MSKQTRTRGHDLLEAWVADCRSQLSLARAVGKRLGRKVAQPTVSKWLSRKSVHMPSSIYLFALRDVCGIPLDAWTEPSEESEKEDDDETPRVAATGTDG